MIFSVFCVAVVFVHAIAGLLNDNVHTGTTTSPDGAVLHQSLGQLVVELDKRVNNLQNKVNALETEKQNYLLQNTQFKTELSTQGRTLESLQRILHQQIALVLSLQTKEEFYNTLSSQFNDSLQNLTTDHENLKSKVEQMKILPMMNDIKSMQGHISDILAAQGSLSGNLSHAQNNLHDLYEHVHQEKPGFTAYAGDSYDPRGTLILPHVYSNVGSLYNTNTGVFTADRTGLYGFYLGIECSGIGIKFVYLVKDGSIIARVDCYPQSDHSYYGSSFSVQRIEKGSKVWAKNAFDVGLFRISLGARTTLSGILISY